MYGMLDNLETTGVELELPYELFKTSFNTPATVGETEIPRSKGEPKELASFCLKKAFTCTVCETTFETYIARDTKLRLSHMVELRSVYFDIEPMCYDVIMCERCGYASLRHKFDALSERQIDVLTHNIRRHYNDFVPPSFPLEVDLHMAVEKHKYALLSALVKKTSIGERAYMLMKISWFYQILQDTENELYFTKYAYEYFTKAYSSERFPIFGMSEATVTYLLGSFAYKLGEYGSALKFLSNIIVQKDAPSRIKDLARDIKDEIIKIRGATENEEESDTEEA